MGWGCYFMSGDIMKTSSAHGYVSLWNLTRQVSVESQPVSCKNFDGRNCLKWIPCSHCGDTAAGKGNLKTRLHSRPLCFSPFQKQWFVNELEKLRFSQGFFLTAAWGVCEVRYSLTWGHIFVQSCSISYSWASGKNRFFKTLQYGNAHVGGLLMLRHEEAAACSSGQSGHHL